MSLLRETSYNDLNSSRNSSRLRRKLALVVQDKQYSMRPLHTRTRMSRWLKMLLMPEHQVLLVKVVDSQPSIELRG